MKVGLEKSLLESRKREQSEQSLYVTVKVRALTCRLRLAYHMLTSGLSHVQVVTDETFNIYQGFDLANFDDRRWPVTELPTFRLLKTALVQTLRATIADYFHVSTDAFKLWILLHRRNKTIRADAPIDYIDAISKFACLSS